MTMSKRMKPDDVDHYLGDGLYVKYDGEGVWLFSSNGAEVLNEVCLEPSVLYEFVQYIERLKSTLSEERDGN